MDFEGNPDNTLQFSYGNHKYTRFTYELLNEENILKSKILKQLIQEFSL